MKGSRPGRAPVDLARTLAGAVKAPFPMFIAPAKPTLQARPPIGDHWQVEFKLDGWRAQLHRQRDAVTVYNSNGGTMALASLGAAAREVPADSFVFDGELVMLGADGRPRRELYVDDGLHMTRKGYLLWIPAIEAVLEKVDPPPAPSKAK